MCFQTKITHLLGMLQLGDRKLQRRLVTQLSGGQRRRLSLACAMIHSPRLLILQVLLILLLSRIL